MKYILAQAMCLMLIGCNVQIDNQAVINAEQSKIVNPTPVMRDFKSINQQHKVLVAILDSGVDYNHPALLSNTHFILDEEGNPTASGWDFAGNDPWAAPYVARTHYFNAEASGNEQAASLKMFLGMQALLNQYPELKIYFSEQRNHEKENSENVFHGTHVAGLASYDSPEIGLLAYRVLPLNSPSELPLLELFRKNLIEGMERAVIDGAQVVNISLGITIDDDTEEDLKDFFRHLQSDLISVVDRYPSIMFVTAAGNEGQIIDGKASTVLPCYLPRPNVICVSALTDEMLPAGFSNIILGNDVTTIFALGENVLSTVPTQSCFAEELNFELLEEALGREEFASVAKKVCLKNALFKKGTGTSMATPLVSRQVAKIMARWPHLGLPEVKMKLLEKAQKFHAGSVTGLRLPFQRPNWFFPKELI